MKHTMPAARRLRQELQNELSEKQFKKIEMLLQITVDVENMQLQKAWKFGKDGQTFQDFMESFAQPGHYQKWDESKL
jgi:hypothetical protein